MVRVKIANYWKTIDTFVEDGTVYAVQQKETTSLYRTNEGAATTSERKDEHRVIEIERKT